MLFLYVLILSLSLAADAFSVSVGYGVCHKNASIASAFRIALATGLFQLIMPLIGWLLGNFLGGIIASFGAFIASVILVIIGSRMIIEAYEKKIKNEVCIPVDISRGKELIIVALATSIDALLAGFSFGMMDIPLALAVITIGLITFILSFSGVFLGKVFGAMLGEGAEIAGGVILILIGIKITVEEIFF